MDRRTFFGSAAAVCGSLVFSRKTEGAKPKGLTHEEMAGIILKHPLTVFLHGDTEYFGRCRDYYYADERRLINGNVVRWSGKEDRIDKWRTGGKAIGCDCCLLEQGYFDPEGPIRRTRTRVINGCRVEVHYHDLPSTRLSSEEWFDISQPKLKLIRCTGRDTHSTKYPRVISRNFARVGHNRWLEV